MGIYSPEVNETLDSHKLIVVLRVDHLRNHDHDETSDDKDAEENHVNRKLENKVLDLCNNDDLIWLTLDLMREGTDFCM